MYDAFISYSRQDSAAIDQLKRDSAPHALNLFLDSARLKPGNPWSAQLGDSIKKARLLLLCWSASAAASGWVEAELRLALLERKAILPWRLDATPLPSHVDTIQAVSTAASAVEFISQRRAAYRRKRGFTAAAAVTILVPSSWLIAQRLTPQKTSFRGIIVDHAQNPQPIPGVTIEADSQHTITLPNGEFSLTLPVPPGNPQALKVHISKPGYQAQVVDTQTDVYLSRILEKAK